MTPARRLAATVVDRARAAGVVIAVAESCTGGLIAAALTDIPGASDVFDRGFVTYSNDAKVASLGVDPATLARFGAVSAETARAMAAGARAAAGADLAVAATGIAGPGGGGPDKPVGLVWFGLAGRGPLRSEARRFSGGRDRVRSEAVTAALRLLLSRLPAPAP